MQAQDDAMISSDAYNDAQANFQDLPEHLLKRSGTKNTWPPSAPSNHPFTILHANFQKACQIISMPTAIQQADFSGTFVFFCFVGVVIHEMF